MEATKWHCVESREMSQHHWGFISFQHFASVGAGNTLEASQKKLQFMVDNKHLAFQHGGGNGNVTTMTLSGSDGNPFGKCKTTAKIALT